MPEEEEIIEEEEQQEEEQSQPLIIETKGKWKDFEVISGQVFEVGKTYKLSVQGQCKFAISPTKPTSIDDGMGTNEITFKKSETNKLWIITGG